MAYLLIIFLILIALAPLVWVKSSPRQQQIARLRRLATTEGLHVTLCHAPDAREGEGRLDQVKYTLSWPVNLATEEKPGQWLLLHHSRRGDPSPWQDWTWLNRSRDSATKQSINEVVEKFTGDVSGLSCNAEGVQLYWREKGSEQELMGFVAALKELQKSLLNASIKTKV